MYKAYLYNVVNNFKKGGSRFLFKLIQSEASGFYYKQQRIEIFAEILGRTVLVDFISPREDLPDSGLLPVLLLNDGQDLAALSYLKTIDRLAGSSGHLSFYTFAIHAADRLHEYGVSGIPDFQDRGSRAHLYHLFLKEELIGQLLPALGIKHEPSRTAIAGFSLGGLSALDFAWQHPELAGLSGSFSGSFWWRSKALDAGYTQADRIMHKRIRETINLPRLSIWLQAGTCDEQNDRTGSGVIDAIADIRDLMDELEAKGFTSLNLHYHEVQEGRHDQQTWGRVMPDFLKWVFESMGAGAPDLTAV